MNKIREVINIQINFNVLLYVMSISLVKLYMII